MSRSARRLDPSRAAPLFAALGDPTRLRLLHRLATDGPGSITALTERAEVTRQAITKHLEVLAAAGLVVDERAGRERTFALVPERLDTARLAIDQLSRRWDQRLARLKAFVEED